MSISEQDFEELEKLGFWTDITNPVLWKLPTAIEHWAKEKTCKNELLTFIQLITHSRYTEHGDLNLWLGYLFLKIPDKDLQTIYKFRGRLRHPLLKATFLQLMWQHRKLGGESYTAAQEAIHAYLANVASLLAAHDKGAELIAVEIKDTLNHLHSLAHQIQDRAAIHTIIQKTFEISQTPYSTASHSLILFMHQLLGEMDIGEEKDKFSLDAIVKILPLVPETEFFKQQCFYDCAIKFAHTLKKQDQEIELKKSKAQTFLNQAKTKQRAYLKAFHLQRAIDIYKTIPDSADLWQPLMLELNSTLKQGTFETHPIRIPEMEEFHKDVERASLENEKEFTKILHGTPLQTKLVFLISLLDLPTKKEIEDSLPEGSSIEDFIPVTFHDERGHPQRTMKGKIPQEKPAFLRSILSRWDLLCNLHLKPVMHIISKEHQVTAQTLLPFCSNNPFIPYEHEHIFAFGLSYFIKGHFLEAASILIPQIENSFRKILEVHTPTFHINKDSFQDNIEMDGLIQKLEALNIFPTRFIFNFKMLFTEKAVNVRNNFAHGKYSTKHFFTAPTVIPLWMVLWFVMYPFATEEAPAK